MKIISLKTFLPVATGLAGFGLYRFRRQLLARQFDLSPVLNDVKVDRNIAVTTPDGIRLMTDHYYPIAAPGQQFPTILIRTPYGRGYDVPFPIGWLSLLVGQRFAERGYHVIIQTVRGRFDSGGVFEPRHHEREDGQATLDWLSSQAWFNGELATWGQSYLGFVQWAIADSPLIKAMMPVITSSRSYEVNYPDGVFNLDLALRWTYALVAQSNLKTQPYWKAFRKLSAINDEKLLTSASLHLPVIEADQASVSQEIPYYRDWLDHPSAGDPYWQLTDSSPLVPQLNAPVHLVSGWYDFMLRELLADYQSLYEAGKQPFLTLGPWFHASPAGFVESIKSGIEWFNARLKDQPGPRRTKPVRYYVMGADEWREADHWPPLSRPTSYFLQQKSQLSIQPPVEVSAPDHYRYDPAQPTPSVGGPLLSGVAGPKDNREVEARSDVLVYTTAELAEAVEINGWVKLVLYVRSSLPHTDFFGRLCDVWPDGRSINICDGLLRVEPGTGEVMPDGSRRLEIGLWATAQRFERGHSLRLQVSSGAHPRWTRNLGTGEPVALATKMLAVDQTIYHDAAHPSALVLPVVS